MLLFLISALSITVILEKIKIEQLYFSDLVQKIFTVITQHAVQLKGKKEKLDAVIAHVKNYKQS